MPTYNYRARGADGSPRQGTMTVSSEMELLRRLEADSLTPIHVELRKSGTQSAAPGIGIELKEKWRQLQTSTKAQNVMLFTRQLATMQSAGLPLVRALKSIAKDLNDRNFRTILNKVSADVEGGRPLSEALAEFPGSFSDVYCRLVYTGEVSGTLDIILKQMAVYLEKAEAMKSKVQAALRYPAFVVVFLAGVVAIIFLKIIPEFAGIYAGLKVDLPIETRIMLGISNMLVHNLPLVALAVIVILFTLFAIGLTRAGRLFYDTIKLHVPIFGELLRLHITSRFTRTLGILTSSGTQILTALKVVAPVPGNARVEEGILKAKDAVEGGRGLSVALAEAKVFPDLLIQMVATGEETGKLDEMLVLTAEYYEQRVTAALDGFTSLIEPILIVILGAVVGSMLFAMYMPIFKIGQAIQGHH